ncbi:MAG: hypothetical protein MUC68_04595 [Burkholderiaceae bacterium]|jgi:hypothetical protein|nr:hypothetical protein [Burkholderiaceae bacterium]
MNGFALRLLLPLGVALAAAYVFDLGRIPAAALVGAALWAGLKLAGRPLPIQFAAFAMFAAVTFGFMAAVFASLIGQDVYGLLAAPWREQFVGIAIALAAVAFGALALVSGLWAMLVGSGGSPPDDEGGAASR